MSLDGSPAVSSIFLHKFSWVSVISTSSEICLLRLIIGVESGILIRFTGNINMFAFLDIGFSDGTREVGPHES